MGSDQKRLGVVRRLFPDETAERYKDLISRVSPGPSVLAGRVEISHGTPGRDTIRIFRWIGSPDGLQAGVEYWSADLTVPIGSSLPEWILRPIPFSKAKQLIAQPKSSAPECRACRERGLV